MTMEKQEEEEAVDESIFRPQVLSSLHTRTSHNIYTTWKDAPSMSLHWHYVDVCDEPAEGAKGALRQDTLFRL